MPMWNMDTHWDCKVEEIARSLHLSRDSAYELLKELEEETCYDDGCEGQMEVCGTKGVVKDVDGCPHPRETYYVCVKCGTKWVYDFQHNLVCNWH